MQDIRNFRLIHVLVIVKEDYVLVPDRQFQDSLSQGFSFLVPAVIPGSDLKVIPQIKDLDNCSITEK